MHTASDLLKKDPPLESIGGIKVTPATAQEIRRLTPKGHFPSETIRDAVAIGLPKLAKARKKGRKT